MLKIIGLLNKSESKVKNSNGKAARFNINGGSEKLAKKSERLFKSQKLAKFKKLSKSRNLPKINIKKAKPIFLTPNIETVFNCL